MARYVPLVAVAAALVAAAAWYVGVEGDGLGGAGAEIAGARSGGETVAEAPGTCAEPTAETGTPVRQRGTRAQTGVAPVPAESCCEPAEAAPMAAIGCDVQPDWFQRQQREDGGWGTGETSDVYATGLVLLCYAGEGETHQSGPRKDMVRRALKFLRSVQAEDGLVGDGAGADGLRAHLTGAFALVENYGLTGSAMFKAAAQRAVARTLAAQCADGGWGRSLTDTAGDIVVTATAIDMLRSAQIAELAVDTNVFHRARAFADSLTHFGTGTVRRSARDAGHDDPLATAAGTHVRLQCRLGLADGDPAGDAAIVRGADWLAARPPSRDPAIAEGDPEYVHRAGLVAKALGEDTLGRWKPAAEAATIENQNLTDGSADLGSSDPGAGRHRLVETAHRVLSLQIFYTYSRVVGR